VSFPDHFSRIAARYAQYRPHYPAELVDALAALSPGRSAAWDAGCGNGQLSVPLGDRFARVWATDASEQQLAAARAHPHVSYRLAPAEASGLADASIDLAVAAQAAHWFDWPRYVAEVERVARPGALAALIAYGNCAIVPHPDARAVPAGHRSRPALEGGAPELVERYYHDLEPYWPAGRVHIMNGYRDLAWPWPVIDPPTIDLVASWTRDELTGYVATWSATQRDPAHGRRRRPGPVRRVLRTPRECLAGRRDTHGDVAADDPPGAPLIPRLACSTQEFALGPRTEDLGPRTSRSDENASPEARSPRRPTPRCLGPQKRVLGWSWCSPQQPVLVHRSRFPRSYSRSGEQRNRAPRVRNPRVAPSPRGLLRWFQTGA
jgi:SAM-dependent methyltransferase